MISKEPIWLVWALEKSGSITLRAIDTAPGVASRHRKALLFEGAAVRVWIEKRETNHLLGAVMLGDWAEEDVSSEPEEESHE